MSDSHHPSPRPTLKTISKLTGFAVATVSRALKDAPDIAQSTKDRVRDVAAEIGYRPNRAGVRLRTGKTNVIALVLSAEDHIMAHTAQLIYSVSETLKGTPYHLVVMPVAAADDPMTAVKYIVETQSADGVILNQTQPEDARVRYLHEANFPFATHGRTDMCIDHASYDFDNREYSILGVRELVARGRKNLLLVSPPPEQNYAGSMIDGFVTAARDAGVSHYVAEKVVSESPVADITEYILSQMTEETPPDGMIFASSSSAMVSIAAAESAGRVIGRDFDVVAKDALSVMQLFRKEIIAVEEDVGNAGRFLAKALIASLEGRSDAIRSGLDIPKI